MTYEVLIRDNASRDVEELYRLESEDVKIIYGSDNIGFGRANNEIARMAQGRFLLFLNPDTILDCDAPSHLINHLSRHMESGACAPRIRNLDGSRQYSWNVGMGLRWELAETFYFQNIWRGAIERKLLRVCPKGPWNVDFSSGACLCIPIEVWRSTGGFDPDFFLNHEDIELCERIRRTGRVVHVLPEVWITHADGGSQKQNWARFVKDLLVAKRIYLRKRFHGPSLTIAYLLWRIRVLSRIALTAIFARGTNRTRLAGYIQAWRQGSSC